MAESQSEVELYHPGYKSIESSGSHVNFLGKNSLPYSGIKKKDKQETNVWQAAKKACFSSED
jgi:hypothetical protein